MTVGKTYKFTLDNIPIITTEEWDEIEAAAKIHIEGKQYPEVVPACGKLLDQLSVWPQLDQDAITKRWKELSTMNEKERIRYLFGEWKCEDTTFNAKTMREDDDDR